MARPLRIEFAGAFYHVTSRGNERKPVFRSKGDRERFLSYLAMGHEVRVEDSLYRKFCVFLSHQYSGLSLEEIGAYFGMKGSAVSQASRRFKARVGEEGETKKMVCRILKKLPSVES